MSEPSHSSPTASATQDVSVAEPLVIPDCETLLPVSDAEKYLGGRSSELRRTEAAGEFSLGWPAGDQGFDELLTATPDSQQCVWAEVGSFESFFTLMVADTLGTDLDALRAHLAESGYAPIDNGDVETYSLEVEASVGSLFATHFLVDDIWMYAALDSQESSFAVGAAALKQLQASNPTRDY